MEMWLMGTAAEHADDSADVVIVGAGPTGLTLAYLLAGKGVPVAVVDPNRIVCSFPRATHLDDETMRTLQLLGLAGTEDAFLCMEGTAYRDQDGVPFVELLMPFGVSDQGWRTDYQFFQPDFEARVRGALSNDANVALWLGWEVTGLVKDDEAAVVTATNRASGETRTLRARYVVGCDGAGSFVRRTVNPGIEDLHGTQRSLIIDVHAFKRPRGLTSSTAFVLYENDDDPITYVPLQKPMYRFEYMLAPGESKHAAEDPRIVYRRLARWLDPADYRILRTDVYEWHAYLARDWRAGRLFLAGDAAHEMPPMLGQGMCSGIRDAVNLAWKLSAVLSGAAHDGLLDTYQSERLPAVRPYIAESAKIANVIDGFRASDQRPERSAPHRGSQFRPPIGPGVHDDTGPSGGRLAPQPRTPGGTLLDDAVGYNFTVVGAKATIAHVSARTREIWRQWGVAALDDTHPDFAGWLKEFGADVALIRPDRYVYATANGSADLDRITGRLAADLPARITGTISEPDPGLIT
jgi:3-(3-hydroxy-phenyl)propionate hydroxylase